MILGQRIRLDPNNVQRTFFRRCAGAARKAYNWGLERWQAQYAAGENPSWQKLNKELNACKTIEFPWMRELSSWVPNQALADLGAAFTNFFRRVKAGAAKPGYPRRKKLGRDRRAFGIAGRDVNAAINLKNLALAQLRVTACCQGSADFDLLVETKLPLGQESGSLVNFG